MGFNSYLSSSRTGPAGQPPAAEDKGARPGRIPVTVPEARPASTAAPEEMELIARILAGEHELYYQLVHPHERSLYVAAYSLLENEADAEDAAQEAVLKAFTNLHQFRGEARFSTWLIRIALNEARSRIRRQATVPMEPLEQGVNQDGDYIPREFKDWREIPSQALEREELRRILNTAIFALGEKYRQVLVLRDIQQLSVAETAAALGLTNSAVKVRLWRARMQLRDTLANALNRPPQPCQ